MTATHSSGPEITYGQLGDANGSGSGGVNPEAGPSVTYQGDCIPDVRAAYQPGITGKGKVTAHLDSPYLLTVDFAPATYTTTGVASLAAASSIGALATLGGFAPGNGIYPGVPIVPAGMSYSAANVVSALGLDVGFGTCNVSAGGYTITSITNGQYLQAGITVAVAGGTAGAWIVGTVLSVSGTSATLNVPMVTATAGVPIALANSQFNQSATPVAVRPYLTAGAALAFDPTQGLCRGLSCVSNNAADTAVTLTVKGYDIYGYAMTEMLMVTGTTPAYGKKAWKYIVSITSGGAVPVGAIGVGTSDVFGLAIRSDRYEYLNGYWNAAFLSASTGWTAGVTTTATAMTGDVRGTWQMSGIGGGTGASANSSNGFRRVAMFITVPLYNLVGATPQNPAPMYGVTQF